MIDKELLLLVLVKLATKAGGYYRAALKDETSDLPEKADGIIEAITEIVEKVLYEGTVEEEHND